MTLVFHRSDPVAPHDRAAIAAPVVRPVWTRDVGSPIWSDALAVSDRAFLGSDDGVLHAIDVRSGTERWAFRAGGAIRARPTALESDVVFQADDGWLYRIGIADGHERWRVRVSATPAVRRSLGIPSRATTIAPPRWCCWRSAPARNQRGAASVLTGQGRHAVWSFTTRDAIVASPIVSDGRVFVGSFDGHVYAIDVIQAQLSGTSTVTQL